MQKQIYDESEYNQTFNLNMMINNIASVRLQPIFRHPQN
jgi:hypothetical protein